jgi:hypothetical protein
LQQKKNELRAAEEAARREAERAAARQRHEEEMRYRRFSCDCRALAISVANLEPFPLADALPANADISILANTASRDCTVLQRLRPAITNVLASVYSSCPASALLPLYVLPPADIAGNEMVELLHAVRTELMKPAAEQTGYTPPILFLPVNGAISNSVLALFENAPDLPGATVLAFDSPWSRQPADENGQHRYPHAYPSGVPNEGAVALFVTNAELPRMLEAASALEPALNDEDAMTPFWERTAVPDGLSPFLVRMPPDLRAELDAQPTLAHIHRASLGEANCERSGILEMTRLFQGLLEQAQLDAALLDRPFTLDEDSAADTEKSPQQLQCARFVHNAGNAGTAGKRLAALGSAMLYFDIDISPVDQDVATNTVICLGNLGCATGATQLALSLAHAAESGTPALCAEFTSLNGIALSIATPSAATA